MTSRFVLSSAMLVVHFSISAVDMRCSSRMVIWIHIRPILFIDELLTKTPHPSGAIFSIGIFLKSLILIEYPEPPYFGRPLDLATYKFRVSGLISYVSCFISG